MTQGRERRTVLGYRQTDIEAGVPFHHWAPTCDGCGKIEKIRCERSNDPPVWAERKLQAKGWRCGQRLLCPDCLHKRKARPEPVMSTPLNTLDPIVVAPRSPNSPDRRRVREALLDHYDEDKGRYFQAHSDVSLAAKLDVPRAWVSELREVMGLGADVCEAQDAYDKELGEIKAEIAAINADVLARIGAVESRLRKLEVNRAYAKKAN